ncbi:biotin/lipoate A/B protein ligase family protein [uncultured Exiguobacterium sp.]|uniref:lipoate--protein ligase family protein n=1 Tax=uncultured Exiguobacterium sp. TaxID=202669 RepID=UPI0025E28D0D|nr:biotin/lipoate A/B protein ligase family protein [uncultured Exiguobacterium sp.]
MGIELLKQEHYRIFDQTSLGTAFHATQSFAMDDTLCASVATEGAALRSWIHHETVVLGIQDARLPHLADGVAVLHEHGFSPVVRNSGGLAVVLDAGVLNISLVLPERGGIDIDSGYEAMLALVRHMFAQETDAIVAGEVVGSYCPGSYDLSIAGKKFAGISQRRVRGGVAVQIYLCVTGSGSQRAALVRDFYAAALRGETTKFVYPTVVPETMASLEELLGISLTVEECLRRAYEALLALGADLTPATLTELENERFGVNLSRMLDRNEKVLG